MPSVVTNSKGEYKFEGLASGRYRVTASKSGWDGAFKPANYEIDVDSHVVRADFAIALLFRPPSTPPGPQTAGGSAPYSISGHVRAFGVGAQHVTVTLESLGASTGGELPDYTPEAPPKFRIIPAGLLAHKQQKNQSTAWCWAIKPRRGNWEGYCSFQSNLELPEYSSLPGLNGAVATVPAMTYHSAYGMTSSAIPTRLQMGKDGVQATVLAFDRDKLLQGYYNGAEFEVFEINYRGNLSERIVWHAGLLGNIVVGDLEATIDLMAWPDLAGRTLGRSYAALCDVGRLVEHPDEEFGAGRCRNQVLNDGPLKADWTVLATIQSAVNGKERTEFAVTYGGTALSGNSLNAAFHDRLAEGKVEFLIDGTGGINAGSVRDIKSGDGNGSGMAIVLHAPLGNSPQPGDKLHLTSGCQRTPEACKAYNNYMNFRGFNPPGRENALRQFED